MFLPYYLNFGNFNNLQYINKLETDGSFLGIIGNSSYSINSLVNEANFKCTTVMFNHYTTIWSGTLNSKYLIINFDANIYLGKDFLITSDVYMLNEADFIQLRDLYSNDEIKNYLDEHNFKPFHYNNESFQLHLDKVTELHDQHYSCTA